MHSSKTFITKYLLVTVVLVAGLAAFKPSTAFSAPAGPVEREFFTVDEDNLESDVTQDSRYSTQNQNMSPMFFSSNYFIQRAKSLLVNLLKWTLHDEMPPQPEEKYIRKLHFGRWINDPNDNTCMNTRARVLVRDSQQDVTFRGNKQCVVEDGLWRDVYTDSDVTSSKGIQIDHMVPLKNAYVSGAWQWDYKTRCLYANYMGYKNHLVAAGSRENMSKGDRAPDKYLPPAFNYRCQYIRDWLAVKLIWKLTMTASEVQAIHEVVTNYGCDMDQFRFTQSELQKQRDNINDNLEFCMINKR